MRYVSPSSPIEKYFLLSYIVACYYYTVACTRTNDVIYCVTRQSFTSFTSGASPESKAVTAKLVTTDDFSDILEARCNSCIVRQWKNLHLCCRGKLGSWVRPTRRPNSFLVSPLLGLTKAIASRVCLGTLSLLGRDHRLCSVRLSRDIGAEITTLPRQRLPSTEDTAV